MDCLSRRIPYRQTGYFTKIVLDYIDQVEQLKPFFTNPPTLQGIKKSIELRKLFHTDRKLLVEELKKAYSKVNASEIILRNIDSLLSENTFTICTAHQPNIFTGPLYFIYKILHTVRIARHLKDSWPEFHFVPVYYMGSEDADLDELGHIYLNDEKLNWNTGQKGAVGKMKIDKEYLKLIIKIEGQLNVLPYGSEIVKLVKECYAEGRDIQSATFRFVNALLGNYGLIVFLPDNGNFKRQMIQVFEDDILQQAASEIVEKSSKRLGDLYKIQANPREINLFYLKANIRERIIHKNSNTDKHCYEILNTNIVFSQQELLKELHEYPERFSPNVILRGLYQESILPNIIFTGGGGELSYWLQLKDLYSHYKVPFPVLLLRNSFLLVEKKWKEKISRLDFDIDDFFLSEQQLMDKLVQRETSHKIKLNGTFTNAEQLYNTIREQAAAIDITLGQHVEALKSTSLRRLHELEKKMLRAEKRKFSDQYRQIINIRQKLFPSNSLQERHDNILYYYAKWGKGFIEKIFEHSLNLEQEFTIVEEVSGE